MSFSTCLYRLTRSLILGLSLLVFGSVSAVAADEVEYNRDIRPILSDKCFFCHGPDAKHREADLRLDIEESAKESAIVPGKTSESELVRRITSADTSERMPPEESGKKLSAKEIDLLKRWISQGAKYQPHWAYVPPKQSPKPTVKNQAWPVNWIDYYLLARWEKEGLKPSPDADAVTIIRRLSFDSNRPSADARGGRCVCQRS